MNKSIIFFDTNTRLINPQDEIFRNRNLAEIKIDFKKGIDENFTLIIDEFLNSVEYTNIIIPACFGGILSDFLGLRFASHIRCTQNLNQEANIFVYSFASINDYFDSECFNILKMKGVGLIDYNTDEILNKASFENKILDRSMLIQETKKLNLPIPLNYEDSHSIANEWAIYRWAKTINATDVEIQKIESKFESNLYLKYLKTVHPITKTNILNDEELEIQHKENPTILYIDDEAEKGWKEIFQTIFFDKNKDIDFPDLDTNYRGKTKNEIIESAIENVIHEDADLVILDFRLHPEDNNCKSIEEVTGYQILKKIKEYNKGIQVIIFSATNKVWNLLALQAIGADGFILKEGPENSIEEGFTKESVLSLKKTISKSLNKKFLKDIYIISNPLFKKINDNRESKPKNYKLLIQPDKLNTYFDYLSSFDSLLYSYPNSLKYSFLQLILIIEDIIKTYYISDEYGNHFVEINLMKKQICLEKNQDSIILKLEPIEKYSKFSLNDFEIRSYEDDYKMFNVQSDRIVFNYRLYCVLYFKYNIDLNKIYKFSNLYRLRSSSVAHIGNLEVTKDHIALSLELLNILID